MDLVYTLVMFRLFGFIRLLRNYSEPTPNLFRSLFDRNGRHHVVTAGKHWNHRETVFARSGGISQEQVREIHATLTGNLRRPRNPRAPVGIVDRPRLHVEQPHVD